MRRAWRLSLLALAFVTGLALATAAAGSRVPVLGHTWAFGQQGYGQARPSTIFNGGDPTGLVRDIKWESWGGREAVGYGVSWYVWPGTSVAEGRTVPGVSVVAFHLGMCRGQPSYNAIAWYFPAQGEGFDPHLYINACTGDYVGESTPQHSCVAMRLAALRVTQIAATHVSCAAAKRLIEKSPVRQYLRSDGRFVEGRFRCGADATSFNGSPVIIDCQLHGRVLYEVLYDVTS